MFDAVDNWLERVTGGQIRKPKPGEDECMQCRVLGSAVFGAAGLHSGVEALRSAPRSGNRVFFGIIGCCFLGAATWRALTPTAPTHD
mmetsp:Transcript_26540/g.47976  ORF Transcript_26540/g.47976 Transcript_26540/m.47976 type:complete len:87 (-) Transcript_26540:86-346(-)